MRINTLIQNLRFLEPVRAVVNRALVKLCLVALTLAQPWALEAQDIKVELIRATTDRTDSSPLVRLFASGGEGGSVQATRKGFGDVTLKLGADSVWTLRAAAAGYWTQPVVMTAATDSVRLVLWPAGRLVGSLAWPPGEDTPEVLKFRFDPSQPEAKGSVASRGTCSLQDESRRFVCVLPAGKHDLAFRVTGYISHYFWDRTLAPGEERDLGDLLLVPGSSVAGWVETQDGRPFDRTTQVALQPHHPSRARQDPAKKLDRFDLTTQPNAKGFFHFEGASEGFYSLRATQKGCAEALVDGVEVVAGYESRLSEPLILGPPRELEVRVTPNQDTQGGNWHLKLFEVRKGRGNVTAEVSCDDLGFANFSGLSPGRFRLMVFEEKAERPFHATNLELERAMTFQDIELAVVKVEGTLFLEDEPLSASLLFGGSFGSRSAKLHSDEDGKFEGYLPEEGEWKVQIESEDPPILTTLAKVEVKRSSGQQVARTTLRLPDLKLKGNVVDEAFKPVRAMIVIRPEGAERDENGLMTDDDGAFELRGLPEGRIHLTAGTPGLTSDEIVVDLVKGLEPAPLQIVLRLGKTIEGTVVSSDGLPVPGATVGMAPWGVLVGQSRSAVTDAQGSFEIELAESTKVAHVLVRVPGYALLRARYDLSDVGHLVLEVSRNWGELEISYPAEKGAWLQVATAGSPHRLALLKYWAQLHAAEGLDEPGRIVVPRLALGTYVACLTEPGSAAWASMYAVGQSLSDDQCVRVNLQPFARESVELTEAE
jgi:hypothetical protein